jgi:hypothetical protein
LVEKKESLVKIARNIGLKKHIAAILIQKIWRGFAARKSYKRRQLETLESPKKDASFSSVNSSTLFEHPSPAKSHRKLESSYQEGNCFMQFLLMFHR